MELDVLPRQVVQVDDAAFDAVVLGDEAPTVVFVNGLGTPLDEWTLVAPTIAKRCRVVCYDRRSAPTKGALPTYDATQIVADLHRLLDALNVAGPLVLVGHSWGGAVIRRYAAEHPADVVGMVYVDATHEQIKGMIPNRATQTLYGITTLATRLGPVRRRLLGTLGFANLSEEAQAAINRMPWHIHGRTARAEYAGIGPSLREMMRTAPDLPPVPTRILLAAGRSGLMYKIGAKQIAGMRAVWEKAAAGRDNVTVQSVADSGHYISLDQPQVVIGAIEDVVTQVS